MLFAEAHGTRKECGRTGADVGECGEGLDGYLMPWFDIERSMLAGHWIAKRTLRGDEITTKLIRKYSRVHS